jgi:hypothetical protein
VQSTPHLHAEDVYAEGDLASGTECVARKVEGDQMAVSGLLDDTPAMKPTKPSQGSNDAKRTRANG